MKPLLFTALLLAATLAFLSPDAASAKGAKGIKGLKKHKPTPVPEKVNAGGATIQSVSGDTIQIEVSKTSTTYKMSNETRIQIDGQRARSTDLKPGMHAEVTGSSLNPGLLLSISAHGLPKK